MLSCHQCRELLSKEEHAAGICPHCGAELAVKTAVLGVDSVSLTANIDADTLVEDVEAQVSAEERLDAAAIQRTLPVHSQQGVRITSEAELDEPLRTVLEQMEPEDDPDRTMGMDSLASDVPTRDVTAAVDSQVGLATDVHDPTAKPRPIVTDRTRGKAQASDSKLNIPQRHIIWTDDSLPPDLSADYEIIPMPGEPRLKGAMGMGGVGIVWKALQRSLNREVAIKQLAESTSEQTNSRAPTGKRKVTERDRRSFLAEAVITAKLEHPNIMPVYDLVSDTQGNRLYTMKLLRNPSWDQVIDEKTEDENLEILRKVCEAIDFAHEQGIVHRDLKPANIVVGEHGEVLVIDWGLAFPLAHFAGPSVSPQQTGRGGSPTYMAPEQADADPSGIGTHTDIYLLGAILFEIVTGFPPHPYRSSAGKSLSTPELFKIVSDNVIIDVEQTGELLDIAHRAMQKSPRERYPSVKKFLEALKSYQKHTESTQLVKQAAKDLQTANETQDYAMFARSVFGFENAQQLWDANSEAREGLLNARLAYAQAALQKKDFDLGLTLVREERPAEAGTYKKLVAGRDQRRKQLARSKLYRTTTALALAALAVGGTGASIWINSARQAAIASAVKEKQAKEDALEAQAAAESAAEQEKIAKEKALLAQAAEEKAKKDEEIAKNAALVAKNDAIEAKDEAVKAKDEAVKAKEAEEVAKNKAVQAAQEEEIAKNAAIKAREDEKQARLNEEQARKEAVVAKEKAEKALIAEQEAKQKADLQWYRAKLQLAGNFVTENAFDSARRVLSDIGQRRKEEQAEREKLTDEERGARPETFSLLGEQAQLDRLTQLCRPGNEDLIPYREENPSLTAAAATSQLLATANADREIQLWSAATKQPLLQEAIKTEAEPSALAISPDNSLLVVGEKSGSVGLWNVGNGTAVRKLEGHQDTITQLTFISPHQLASASLDKERESKLILWNLHAAAPDQERIALKGHPGNVAAMSVVSNVDDGPIGLVTGGTDRQIRYWPLDPRSGKSSTFLLEAEEAVTALAAVVERPGFLAVYWGDVLGDLRRAEFAFDSIKTQAGNGAAITRKADHWLTAESLNRHTNGISRVLLDPVNSQRLISVGGDNLIRVWNIEASVLSFQAGLRRAIRFDRTSEEKNATAELARPRELRGHGNAIVDAAAWKETASETSRLLTASLDGTARVWEPEGKDGAGPMGDKVLSRSGAASGDVLAVSVAKAADRVLAVSRDGIGMVWDLSIQPAPIELNEGHRFLTQAAVKLSDLLVTVSFDGTAAVWDTQTNAMLEKRTGIGPTGVLAGSRDGKFVITGFTSSRENKRLNLQVWPLEGAQTGQLLSKEPHTLIVGQEVSQDQDQPEAVAVSPSGRWAAVGTRNGFLQVFSLTAPRLNPPTSAHPLSRDKSLRVPSGVMGVAFLGESEIATAGLDGWLRFWTIASGDLKPHPQRVGFEFRDPDERDFYRVKSLAASEDGRTLAAAVRYPLKSDNASETRRLEKPQIWILEVGDSAARIVAKVQPEGAAGEKVQSVAVSGNGRKVIVAINLPRGTGSGRESVLREWTISADGTLSVEDVLKPLKGDDSEIAQAVFASPETTDEIIVSGNALTNVWKRDANGQEFLKRTAAYGPMMAMHACDLSHDGAVAVTASHDLAPAGEDASLAARLRGEIRVWQVSVEDGELKAPRVAAESVRGAVKTVAICPTDSELIAVGGYQPSEAHQNQFAAQLFRRDGTRLRKIQEIGSHDRPIVSVGFSTEGTAFVTVASDGSVSLAHRAGNLEQFQPDGAWNLSMLPEALRLGELVAADLSGDGRWLAVADRRAAVVVDAKTGQPVVAELLQGHASDLTDVRFSAEAGAAESPRLWSTSLDGSIKYWSLSEPDDQGRYAPRPMMTLRGHQRGVLTLAALPDGGIASGGNDGRVILWPGTRPD